MADEPLGSWERIHHNGHVAMVLELLWTKKNDAYSYGAMPAGSVTSMGRAKGLGHAKELADVESGCPQPCRCAPWFP